MKLENDFLCVEIAELGAEVTRIYDKETGNEVLWNGNPKYWKRHSPVLFPNVGRTWQNTVLINGVKYPTSMHGFARDTVFTCIKSATDSVTYMMRSSEETKEVYPFDFELHITYYLRGKELEVEWEVKNRSEDTMYYTIGGHPAFWFSGSEETKEDYILKFPGKKTLQYVRPSLETGTALVDQVYTLELDNETCSINDEMFAQDALIFDDGQVEEIWLCHKDGSPYVGMRCPGIISLGVWSVKNAPFVSFETWAGRCDDYGFDKDISEKRGINKVESGKTLVKSYTIVVA